MRLSPIAITAIVAAAVAVAVVVTLQSDDPGRVTAIDALAIRVPGSDDARLTMTLSNDGGDDHILGLVVPIARAVRLVHGNADEEVTAAADAAAVLDLPARSSVVLNGEGGYILASGVDWSALYRGESIPLSIQLERSDAITVFVAVDGLEP